MSRSHRLLRLSVTDRCNLRCQYCMGPEGVGKLPHSDLLPLEDLAAEAAWLCARLDLRNIKLTGGEPLVRAGLVSLVSHLSGIPTVEEVSLITNGTLLGRHAAALKVAGLSRVTISLDSLDPERYRVLTRGGQLRQALEGIAAAQAAGFTPIKLNAVLQRSTWREDVPRMLDFATAREFPLRFIELMQTGTEHRWCEAEYVPALEVRQWLSRRTTVLSIAAVSGPARQTRVAWNGTEALVGWITPRSQPFCDCCDRLRMDARGRLHRCLMDPEFFPLSAVRRQLGDETAEQQLWRYLSGKTAPGRMEKSDAMVVIGG